MPLQQVRLTVAYDGADFYGFQRQPDRDTVQGKLENALSRLTGDRVSLVAAGRTDAGVHALGQVVHFETEWAGPIGQLPYILSSWLDPAVAVLEAKLVGPEFHARFSARFRRYGYLFFRSRRPDPLRERFALRILPELNLNRMMDFSHLLVGRRDFGAFASRLDSEHSLSTVREVQRVRWCGSGKFRLLLIQADGFLRHMVRGIVGSLLKVGAGTMSFEEWRCLVERAERVCEFSSAPAAGLCLLRVGY
ncbi:MAG: tRNA pseudouridine(38-40) synthase TruA [Armatimonadota bacterium]|nr:tRNA pseudouridine(38-40) synthase TruA [Armatimonadota bacterium]